LSIYQKTSGTASLQFDSEVSGEIEISLYSIDGRLCQQWHLSIQKGVNQINAELNSVTKGFIRSAWALWEGNCLAA